MVFWGQIWLSPQALEMALEMCLGGVTLVDPELENGVHEPQFFFHVFEGL